MFFLCFVLFFQLSSDPRCVFFLVFFSIIKYSKMCFVKNVSSLLCVYWEMICFSCFQVMLVIGGQAPKAIRSVECYDFKEDRWCQLAEMPSRRCRCGELAQSICTLTSYFLSVINIVIGQPHVYLVWYSIIAWRY